MAKKTLIGSVKRFGPRYGRSLKEKFGIVETLQKKTYKCPSCNNLKLKRVSLGIWECKKCGHKMASKAYTITKKSTKKHNETSNIIDQRNMTEADIVEEVPEKEEE